LGPLEEFVGDEYVGAGLFARPATGSLRKQTQQLGYTSG
jgi:hypothetical protein